MENDNYLKMALLLIADQKSNTECIVDMLLASQVVARSRDAERERRSVWMRIYKERELSCPNCGSSQQVWVNPVSVELTCHRLSCGNRPIARPMPGGINDRN